jgi:hypothetical protein
VKSTRPLVAVVAALAVALAVLGFFFGMGSAPTAGDAKSERAAAYKDAVASGKKGDYRRHFMRGYRVGLTAGKARAERAKRRARERRTAAQSVDRPQLGSTTTGGAGSSASGCDATYVFPDGTTGCAR